MIPSSLRSPAAVIVALACTASAFTSPRSSKAVAPSSLTQLHIGAFFRQDSSGDLDTLLGGGAVTPEGFGFSTPASRILAAAAAAGGDGGYHRAGADDPVADVIAAISSGSTDVALVFDAADALLGAFAEKDYIKFSSERAAQSSTEEDSASFLVASVSEYITPTAQLSFISAQDTASKAITTMKNDDVRYVVVADQLDATGQLFKDSDILGVVNLQEVMCVIQKDERSSLSALAQKYPSIQAVDSANGEAAPSGSEAEGGGAESSKKAVIRVGTGVLSVAALVAFFSQSQWLHEHADLAMIAIFVLGYIGIIFEEVFEFDKAAVALLMSTGLWVTYADYFQNPDGTATSGVVEQLGEQLAEVSDICFFLLAASTIVEVVDAHEGFKVVTNQIKTTSKKGLFWTIGFLTFFLSAILNNLTVTIVMCSLLRKLIPDEDDRKLFGAMVVVAANAGGVWTPIGDVTTTMLWINNQLSTVPTITELFLPSVVCLVASLAFLVNQVEEDPSSESGATLPEATDVDGQTKLVFWAGIVSLLCVPVFNEFTGLPPYLAMLTGLGAMWTLTDVIHMGEEEEGEDLKVPAALSKLDTAGILFFLGILMSIGVLDKSGLLKELAVFLSNNLPSLDIIATVIGIASALIDNVPLVAATMGMYDVSQFPTDDKLWQLIALCAGTGGSILVIGSASGVALMGLEKVDFLWYAKKVSFGAAAGYFAGIAAYLAQNAVLSGSLFSSAMPQAVAAVDAIQQSGLV